MVNERGSGTRMCAVRGDWTTVQREPTRCVLRVGRRWSARGWSAHLIDRAAGEVRHVAEDREDDDAGEEGRRAVDQRHQPTVQQDGHEAALTSGGKSGPPSDGASSGRRRLRAKAAPGSGDPRPISRLEPAPAGRPDGPKAVFDMGARHASRTKLCEASLYEAKATSVPHPTPTE